VLKKGVRELKILLERSEAPSDIVQCAADLYSILSQTADKQAKSIPNYNSFLRERITRWKLFMKLKEYALGEDARRDVREKFEFIWTLLPPLGTGRVA